MQRHNACQRCLKSANSATLGDKPPLTNQPTPFWTIDRLRFSPKSPEVYNQKTELSGAAVLTQSGHLAVRILTRLRLVVGVPDRLPVSLAIALSRNLPVRCGTGKSM
jgi:hypothetical protein